MKAFFFFGMAAIALACSSAAAAATTDDFQVWTSLQASGSLSGPVVGGLELVGRFVDDSSRLGVAIVRPTIGYKLSDKATVFLGYSHLTTINPGRRDGQEDQIFQQLTLALGKVAGGSLMSRTRFEQRFSNSGRDTGLRFRLQIKYAVPIRAKGPSVVVSSEPLIALNTTDWGQRAGIDQWRNFVGVNAPLAKKLNIETGFQHRYQRRFNQLDRSDFIVPITVAYRF